jgi:hypothetical protein
LSQTDGVSSSVALPPEQPSGSYTLHQDPALPYVLLQPDMLSPLYDQVCKHQHPLSVLQSRLSHLFCVSLYCPVIHPVTLIIVVDVEVVMLACPATQAVRLPVVEVSKGLAEVVTLFCPTIQAVTLAVVEEKLVVSEACEVPQLSQTDGVSSSVPLLLAHLS